MHIYPDYYKSFRCIAHKCRHNCCIGWEIGIDEDTLAKYQSTEGTLGERLRQHTDPADACFILPESKRCPFLNSCNLCDIIIEGGEEMLSVICREHPRFHTNLPGRVESGLGLCCEEAARIILSNRAPVTFICEGGEDNCDDEIIILRDRIIGILQNRSISVDERVSGMLALSNREEPSGTLSDLADFLLSLERLNESWTDMLLLLKDKGDEADMSTFDLFMKEREYEYEQLLVYLIYRHFAVFSTLEEAACVAAFAALCYRIIKALGAVIFARKGSFTLEDQVELVRLFSSEVEYSDENLTAVLEELFI